MTDKPRLKRLVKKKSSKIQIGWQEWCALPKLHIPAIKTKIDTGAKTSALHAWDIDTFHRHGELYVHFMVHPIQRNSRIHCFCTSHVVDKRSIMNTAGHKENRYIITTPITLGSTTWEIEIGLTNRDPLAFRMLLGRDALKGHTLIDPAKTLCQGKMSSRILKKLYTKHHLHTHHHSYPWKT